MIDLVKVSVGDREPYDPGLADSLLARKWHLLDFMQDPNPFKGRGGSW